MDRELEIKVDWDRTAAVMGRATADKRKAGTEASVIILKRTNNPAQIQGARRSCERKQRTAADIALKAKRTRLAPSSETKRQAHQAELATSEINSLRRVSWRGAESADGQVRVDRVGKDSWQKVGRRAVGIGRRLSKRSSSQI